MTASTEALLRSIFGVDDSGNTFIRLVKGEPSGELKNAVSARSNRSLDTLLKSVVVLDSDGFPALRICEVSYGETVEEADLTRRVKMETEKKEREDAQFLSYKKSE